MLARSSRRVDQVASGTCESPPSIDPLPENPSIHAIPVQCGEVVLILWAAPLGRGAEVAGLVYGLHQHPLHAWLQRQGALGREDDPG